MEHTRQEIWEVPFPTENSSSLAESGGESPLKIVLLIEASSMNFPQM